MIDGSYSELALLLMLSALAGLLAIRLRQPLLIAYILVGIAVGPSVLGLVPHASYLQLFAQIGLTVLLFLVGLKLDLHHVRHIGPVAIATGIGQLAFTIAFSFLLVSALGREWLESLYIAAALTFSSTIIVVKLLSDKRDLDSLHGRIAVGILIVQDIAVVVAMIAMSTLNSGENVSAAAHIGLVFITRVGAAAVMLFLMMRYVLPWLVDRMAESQELLLIFAIAWGIALASLGEWSGFSKEAGAFLAGFTLASTTYREALSARLTSLRDFLLLFFFIDLGANLDLSIVEGTLGSALLLSAFVLVAKPLIVMSIMGRMGYRSRTSFLAAGTLAQVSEFSIIFIAMGVSLGHVTTETLGLTTLVGIITITLSTYTILYAQPLYERLAPLLRVFERSNPFREVAMERAAPTQAAPQVLIFGLGRYGRRLLHKLDEAGIRVAGIDFDPEAIRTLRKLHLSVRFGDAEDRDLIESLPLSGVKWIVCALPEAEAIQSVLEGLRARGYRGQVAAVVRRDTGFRGPHEIHPTWILNPFNDAADFAARELVNAIRRAEQ